MSDEFLGRVEDACLTCCEVVLVEDTLKFVEGEDILSRWLRSSQFRHLHAMLEKMGPGPADTD